jgi:hypothetical protein
MSQLQKLDNDLWLNAQQGAHVFKFPDLDEFPDEALQFGQDASNLGLVFIPFQLCVFRCCMEDHAVNFMMYLDYIKESGDAFLQCAANIVRKLDGARAVYEFGFVSIDGQVRGWIPDDNQKIIKDSKLPDDQQLAKLHSAIYSMLGLLSSGMGKIETIPAPEKLNKKRIQNDKPPITEHIIVHIHPKARKRYRAEAQRKGVKLHWRRGHLRKLGRDHIVIVKPHLVGSRKYGETVVDAYDLRSMIAIKPKGVHLSIEDAS